MRNIRKITDDIVYVGASDRRLALFENIYPIPRGVSYNSYIVLDEKTCLMDTVDLSVSRQFFENIQAALDGRKLDYLVVHHMEPDHSASISLFMDAFPETVIVSSQKAFPMMKAFFGTDYAARRIIVKEGDVLCLGKHTLSFIAAPMVHWPEVMMSYDEKDKALFSAEAFFRTACT